MFPPLFLPLLEISLFDLERSFAGRATRLPQGGWRRLSFPWFAPPWASGVGEAETTMKLKFSRYLLLAWLPAPELHRADFPQMTEVRLLFFAHGRPSHHTDDDDGDDDAAAAAPPLLMPPLHTAVPVEMADCQTRAMKLNVRHFSPVVLQLLGFGSAAVAGTAFGMMMRRPSTSFSWVSYLVKVLAHALGRSPHLHVPSRSLGTSPNHFVVVSAPSCARAAGLTALCCVKTVVVIGIAAMCWAAVEPAVTQSLSASVVIPLLRERGPG